MLGIQRIANMRFLGSASFFAAFALAGVVARYSALADVNVTQYHNSPSRDGVYVDPAFTTAAVVGLKRDFSFDGSILGNVYAQPLYVDGGTNGRALVIAVTESDNVYALDPTDGTIVWQRNVGVPVPLSALPCGNIDPLGITGTPVVDLASRSLFFDAVTADGGPTPKHLIYSLNVDTGTTNTGWPVDVGATAAFGTNVFQADTQNQRSALAILGGSVYVPYGGHWGDCGIYHGWVVGIPLDNPTNVTAWVTAAVGGGSWAVGGVASDGVDAYISTGNTFNATEWSGGDAIIRLQPGPVFSGVTADYWAPTNWPALDTNDLDLAGSGPLLVDVPGATPSQLVLAMGKDQNVYLLNRTNLGGVGPALAQVKMAGRIIQAPVTYQTTQGVYVVLECNRQLVALGITPTSPPTLTNLWSVEEYGRGSPFVTSSDGTHDLVVWGIGNEGDQRLRGFDPDTGVMLYTGGSTNEAMTGTRRMGTAIVARGRIYVGTDNQIYAFAVPPSITSQPTNQIALAEASATFQLGASGTGPLSYQWLFNGTNLSGATDSVLNLTNVQASQTGSYSAVVTNQAGSLTSAVAQLTVLVPPFFTLQPSNQSVLIGADAQFQALAGGSPAPDYEWTFENVLISGATNNVLLLTNVQPEQAGDYAVILINAAGSITSLVATLTVGLSPTISNISMAGAIVSFDVDSIQGQHYLLEYKDTLSSPNWISLPPAVTGTGGALSLQDTNAVGSTRFYRVHSF